MVFAIGLFIDILYQIKVTFSFYFDESLYHKLVLDFYQVLLHGNHNFLSLFCNYGKLC